MAEAVELRLPDGTSSGAWMCSRCRNVVYYHGATELACKNAMGCCVCRICGKPLEHRWSIWCEACEKTRFDKAQADREAEYLGSANYLKPAEYNGPVFTPAGRFFVNLNEFDDHYSHSKDAPHRPEYVWCAEPVRWTPDLSDYVVDQIRDNFHEDAEDQLDETALKELDEFARKWWADNRVDSWTVDYSGCVLVNPITPKEGKR